jgi:hypothetical protein
MGGASGGATSVGTSVGAGTTGTAGAIAGSTGSTSVAGSGVAQICDEPAPWPVPTNKKVVGDGTAASCTADKLRAAASAGGYVTFNCGEGPVTIPVATTIQVGTQTVIDGEKGNITLDGGGAVRILWVPGNKSLSVRNLRFVNGKTPAVEKDSSGIGGAVGGDWRSKIEVRNCTFEDNVAGRGGGAVAVWTGSSLTVVGSRFLRNHSWYGGAIYSLLSPLQIINCEFVDNSTLNDQGTGDGGAIGTDGGSEYPDDAIGGKIEICGSTVRGSEGYGNGGAAYIWAYPPDQIIVDRSTFASNTGHKNKPTGGSLGGAARISNGEIVIKASSFLSNTSEGIGGGLYLDCAPSCTITNSTFYANTTTDWGGAIFSGTASGKYTFNNVTFADNKQRTKDPNATFGGGTWVFNNTVFSNNGCATAGTGAHVLRQGGSGTCATGETTGDPKLAPPADNGGPTFTMLPATGSAALGAGADCEATDQRGQARVPAACDLGAVEVP